MTLRTISRGIVVALVVVVGVVIVIHDRVTATQAAPQLAGTDLGGVPAPNFTLMDQTGARVSLAGLRGQPVVLTFLYTHCPDQCPLTAEKLRMTADQLGAQAGGVAWLAVSVDPQGDTPATAAAFVHAHGLDGRLRYLLGSQQALAPVWQAYHIAVQAGANGVVNHDAALYLIDARGHERVFLDPTFAPAQLAGDVRALLAAG